MRGLCIASLGLTLGLLLGSAGAQEVQWRPVPGPAVTPVPANTVSSSPGVTLRPPVALSAEPAGPGTIVNTSFTDPTALTARGKLLNDDSRPLPIGTPSSNTDVRTTQVPLPAGSPTEEKETWGPEVSSWQGCDHCGGGGTSTPLCCDGGSCCGSGSCGATLWSRCKNLFNCSSCTDGCCDLWAGDGCLPKKNTFYASAEYLLWTVKSMGLPPLVTANVLGNFPAIGNPGTGVAYGGDSVGSDIRSGGRFTVGFALPCVSNTSFEATWFFLSSRTTTATFAGTGTVGSESIGRPFTEVGPFLSGFAGNQNAELVSANGLLGANTSGRVTVSTSNDLWGIEANLRHNLASSCCWNVDVLLGFRTVVLEEDLTVAEDVNSSITGIVPPIGMTIPGATRFQVYDHFLTRNNFYGGQVGLDGEWRWKRWFIGATGKLGLGDMHQVAVINGETVTLMSGTAPTVASGGLLAQPTNIGRYGRDTFAVVPELALKVGYNFTDHLRGYVGYDVIYLSSVVRPGDIVDTNINSLRLPRLGGTGAATGPSLPGFQFRTSDFWAQGVNFGFEWRY
jgi:hypothetical protein